MLAIDGLVAFKPSDDGREAFPGNPQAVVDYPDAQVRLQELNLYLDPAFALFFLYAVVNAVFDQGLNQKLNHPARQRIVFDLPDHIELGRISDPLYGDVILRIFDFVLQGGCPILEDVKDDTAHRSDINASYRDSYNQVVNGYEQIYDTVMVRDEIPAYTFLMKLAKPDKAGIDEDVKKVVWQLTRVPQYMTGTQTYNNIYRKDYFFSDIGDSESISSNPMWNYTLPLDERRMMKMNDNVRKPDSGNKSDLLKKFDSSSNFNYDSLYLYDPSPYTIPYWMGIYFNIVKEAE
jgi:hypothetical protein